MNDNGNADILRQKNYNAVSRTIILSYKFSVQNYADGFSHRVIVYEKLLSTKTFTT